MMCVRTMESEKENSNYIKPSVECKIFQPRLVLLLPKCPILAETFSITLTVFFHIQISFT